MSKPTDFMVVIDHENKRIELRQSAIQTFLNCRRRFYWEYIRGLEIDWTKDGHRPWKTYSIGSAFHHAMEVWYKASKNEEALVGWPDKYVEEWYVGEGYDPALMTKNLDLPIKMARGHIDDLAQDGADIGEEVLAIEQEYAAVIEDVWDGWTVVVHCQIDRVTRTEEGVLIIDDWKTTDKLDSAMGHIQQLGRYACILRHVEGLRADRVRTTQVKKVKRQGEGPFYARPWVPLNEEAYATHAKAMRDTLRDLVRCVIDEHSYHENVTTECGWKCRVDSLCLAQQHGDDTELVVDLHYRQKGTQ